MTDSYGQNNINQQYPVRARFVEEDDFATNDDDLIIFTNAVTLTLALADQRPGQNLYLKAIDSVAGFVTVVARPGETIDGLPSIQLQGNANRQESFIIKSDGISSWKIVACCDGANPPSEGQCENTVVVQASAPFATLPSPGSGGEISLLPDTIYQMCGDVDIGSAFLLLTETTVVCGMDPLVDSVTSSAQNTVVMPNGGTFKDIAARNTGGSAASTIVVGGDGETVGTAVLFNFSVGSQDGTGIQMSGTIGGLSLARAVFSNSATPIRIGSAPTAFGAISIDQILASNLGSSFIGIHIESDVIMQSFSVSQSAFTGSSPSDIGIKIDSVRIDRIRASSCAYLGPGRPSEIAQIPPLPNPATLGSAVQSESVGCVGFENSLQRGSAQIVNRPTITPAAVGTFVPVGNGFNPGTTYTLDSAAVRVSLIGGTAETQFLQFDRDAPYSGIVAVSLSVQVAVGFTFTPRIIAAQIEVDGSPVGAAFRGTTPDFSTAAPVSISFSAGVELNKNSTVRLLIANETDAANLFVVAAKVTIA